jgi:hypothetical protein
LKADDLARQLEVRDLVLPDRTSSARTIEMSTTATRGTRAVRFEVSRSAMSRSRSLYEGTRSSQPSGAIIPSRSAISATSGTSDWR